MESIAIIIGTRPEAIKMAPVVLALKKSSLCPKVILSGQHNSMVETVLKLFKIKPDHVVKLKKNEHTLPGISSVLIKKFDIIMHKIQPKAILVQGDTVSAYIGASIGFFHKCPVGHIEAGLRTYNPNSPWPEETLRRLIAPMATWHFAPTQLSKDNLLSEQINKKQISITGNTIVDAMQWMMKKLKTDKRLERKMLKKIGLHSNEKLVLVTSHRCENIGKPLQSICKTLLKIAQEPNTKIVLPVHPNPRVKKTIESILGETSNIALIEPLDYLSFLYLMSISDCILTDSGGIQEEACSLNTPLLIMRDTTERPEAIYSGHATLVGTQQKAILSHTLRVLNQTNQSTRKPKKNPFGDGKASIRITQTIEQYLYKR